MTTFTRAQLDDLGVATDLTTAARALGIARGTAYELAAKGEFPCRVIRYGQRYSVPTAGLRELILGETSIPADELADQLDRIADAMEELVRHARVQSANSATILRKGA